MERRIVYENFLMKNSILRNSSDEIYMKKMEEIRNRENKFMKNSPEKYTNGKRKSQNKQDLMYMHKVQKDNELLENKIKKIIQQRSSHLSQKFNILRTPSVIEIINKNKETMRKLKEKNLDQENRNIYDRIKNILPVISASKTQNNEKSIHLKK